MLQTKTCGVFVAPCLLKIIKKNSHLRPVSAICGKNPRKKLRDGIQFCWDSILWMLRSQQLTPSQASNMLIPKKFVKLVHLVKCCRKYH